MTAALDRISKDEQLRADFRRKGLKQAASFSWRRTAEAHLDAYRLAVSVGPDSGRSTSSGSKEQT